MPDYVSNFGIYAFKLYLSCDFMSKVYAMNYKRTCMCKKVLNRMCKWAQQSVR